MHLTQGEFRFLLHQRTGAHLNPQTFLAQHHICSSHYYYAWAALQDSWIQCPANFLENKLHLI